MAKVNKMKRDYVYRYFQPWFSWWCAIRAEECGVQIEWIDWAMMNISVVGDDESRERFRRVYQRLTNPFMSLFQGDYDE